MIILRLQAAVYLWLSCEVIFNWTDKKFGFSPVELSHHPSYCQLARSRLTPTVFVMRRISVRHPACPIYTYSRCWGIEECENFPRGASSSRVFRGVLKRVETAASPAVYTETEKDLACRHDTLLQVGSLVARLEAQDADSGQNAEIDYSIASGNDDNAFDVDPSTGIVTVGDGLLARLQQGGSAAATARVHRLVVVARDRGVQPLQAVADLAVCVNESALVGEELGRYGPAAGAGEADGTATAVVAGGAAIGGALTLSCLLLVAILVCLIRRRRRRRRKLEELEKERRARSVPRTC